MVSLLRRSFSMRVLAVMLLLIPVAAFAQTTREETVVLDAAEKRIVHADYHDDQAVTLSGPEAGGWRLYAGAAIDAKRIDLTMRNVRGEVHYRADWTRIAGILDRSRRERALPKVR